MFLTAIYRAHHIKSRLSSLRMQQARLQDEQIALSTYAANIADGIITPEEMANSPHSIFGRQMMYMMNSVPAAMIQGNQAYQFYLPQYQAQMNAMANNPSMGMMMQANPMMLQTQFFQQALERQGKIEQEKLHVEEKKLDSKMRNIDIQIQMLEAELKALKTHISESIKENAPTFGRGQG